MLRAQRQQKGGFRVKGEQVRAETWQQGGKWSKEGINPMVERKKQRAEKREREKERGLDQSPKRQPTPGLSLAKIRLVGAGLAAPPRGSNVGRGWRVLWLRRSLEKGNDDDEGREPFRRRLIDSCCSISPLLSPVSSRRRWCLARPSSLLFTLSLSFFLLSSL